MDPARIFRTLLDEGVAFVLVGGLAATAHGSTLGTFDVDVCFRQDETNCRRLAAALVRLDARTYPTRDVAIPITSRLVCDLEMLHLATPAGRLDLFAEIPGLGRFENFAQGAESIEFEGLELRILSLDQLILAKTALSGRKDREQLEQLLELRKLKEGG